MKPSRSSTSSPGAEAPKRSTATDAPASPIQRSQPSEIPASTDSRAPHVGRNHLVAVLLRLLGEELPARHRDDADVDVHRERGLVGHAHLGAGREQHDVGLAVAGLPERVRAAKRPLGRSDLGAVERRQLLARERQRDGTALALERDPPRHRRLVGVAGPHVPEVRDRPQRHVVLDRLVGRPVLAEADRVVRPDPERLHVAERREPDGGAHVVREDEERRAVRLQHPLRERDAVHDRSHRVLADPERDVAPRVGGREHAGALELRLRRLDEIGGSSDHRRRERLDRLHHLLAGVAGGHPLPGRELRQRLDPAGPRLAGPVRLPLLAELRKRLGPELEAVVPLLLGLDPGGPHVHVLVDGVGDVEVLVRDRARAPPSPPAPRPRRAARRGTSTCRPRSARRRRCGCARSRATAAPPRPAPRESRARARRRPRSPRPTERASPGPRSASPCPRS